MGEADKKRITELAGRLPAAHIKKVWNNLKSCREIAFFLKTYGKNNRTELFKGNTELDLERAALRCSPRGLRQVLESLVALAARNKKELKLLRKKLKGAQSKLVPGPLRKGAPPREWIKVLKTAKGSLLPELKKLGLAFTSEDRAALHEFLKKNEKHHHGPKTLKVVRHSELARFMTARRDYLHRQRKEAFRLAMDQAGFLLKYWKQAKGPFPPSARKKARRYRKMAVRKGCARLGVKFKRARWQKLQPAFKYLAFKGQLGYLLHEAMLKCPLYSNFGKGRLPFYFVESILQVMRNKVKLLRIFRDVLKSETAKWKAPLTTDMVKATGIELEVTLKMAQKTVKKKLHPGMPVLKEVIYFMDQALGGALYTIRKILSLESFK